MPCKCSRCCPKQDYCTPYGDSYVNKYAKSRADTWADTAREIQDSIQYFKRKSKMLKYTSAQRSWLKRRIKTVESRVARVKAKKSKCGLTKDVLARQSSIQVYWIGILEDAVSRRMP
jgi:hypothetical protein